MRSASISRKTAETDIAVSVGLDGTGQSKIATGIGFLDHMLDLFARHGLFDLEVKVDGDLHIDQHQGGAMRRDPAGVHAKAFRRRGRISVPVTVSPSR